MGIKSKQTKHRRVSVSSMSVVYHGGIKGRQIPECMQPSPWSALCAVFSDCWGFHLPKSKIESLSFVPSSVPSLNS